MFTLYWFWYPAPNNDKWFWILGQQLPLARDQWLWLLWLWLPLTGIRWLVHRRLWTRTPLDFFFLAFIGVSLLNIEAAPYTRGILMLGRPLLGIMLYVYCVEYAREHGHIRNLLIVTTLFSLALGLLAIFSTQWHVSKAEFLRFITDSLPAVDIWPEAYTTFNPNEIAGGIAWLWPVVVGIALYSWQQRWLRWLAFVTSVVMFIGLFLGQSRFVLIGIWLAFSGMMLLPIADRRKRYLALAGAGLVMALEVVLVLNLLPTATNTNATGGSSSLLSERDESSLVKRVGLWESGLSIIRDYPLTGVGMSMYRHPTVRQDYPAPGNETAPHAHNEFIQIGADLGLPGLFLFTAWYVIGGWMLVQCWRKGDAQARILATAVAGGLLAHVVFGMGDAITLWDRLAFVFWWLLGLVGAQYILVSHTICPDTADNS